MQPLARTIRLLALGAAAFVGHGCGVSNGSLGVPVPAFSTPIGPGNPIGIAARDGVALKVVVDATTIAPGQPVLFDVGFENQRAERVTYAGGDCFTSVALRAPLPLDPAGRGDWTGRAAWFKGFAIAQGTGPGGVLVTEPLEIILISSQCDASPATDAGLAPGATLEATFAWNGGYGRDLPALPGEVRLEVSTSFDRVDPGPPQCDPSNGICGTRIVQYEHRIAVEGSLRVVGPHPGLLTAGEAIDAALADGRFAEFLEAQDLDTCQTVNLLLENVPGGGYLPGGPSWTVELYCETAVTRRFARVSVDALLGDVRGIDICEHPCER